MLNLNKNLIVSMLALAALVVVGPQMAEAKAGFYLLSAEDNGSNGVYCDNVHTNPAPVIYTINPSVKEAGSPTTDVVIRGANLLPCSVAMFNGEARPTRLVNSTELVMEVFSGDLAVAGKYLVTVVNPGPVGGFSNALTMTVVAKAVPVTATVVNTAPAVSTGGASVKSTVTPTATTNGATVEESTGVVNGAATSTASNLGASAGNASGSFMPDTLLEWLLLIVLIFVGIKLFRKLNDDGRQVELKKA
ncbi:MAG: hypothetical protein KDH96_11480 [Candidatus Riesia sp.]|nr:hypothetical protein [Candidatus Riesia sp.]